MAGSSSQSSSSASQYNRPEHRSERLRNQQESGRKFHDVKKHRRGIATLDDPQGERRNQSLSPESVRPDRRTGHRRETNQGRRLNSADVDESIPVFRRRGDNNANRPEDYLHNNRSGRVTIDDLDVSGHGTHREELPTVSRTTSRFRNFTANDAPAPYSSHSHGLEAPNPDHHEVPPGYVSRPLKDMQCFE